MDNKKESIGSVEKIVYRGWDDCYLIKTNSLRIIINASAGGRLMVFERNGINVIYENQEQDGKLLADYLNQEFDPDGGRFDYGQELITRDRHALTYMGRWKGEIIDNLGLKITSQPDQKLGILSQRFFTMDNNLSALRITQTMKNISEYETSYFFWGRTLVKPGGKIFLPINSESRFPDKWGRYIWSDPVVFESDPFDPGVEIKDSFFTLIPEKAQNQKYGCDSEAGWMAYGINGLIFLKKYGFSKDSQYTEHFGQTNVFYTNKTGFAEMEPISPQSALKPGEEFSYVEDWYLFEYPPANSNDFNVSDATNFITGQLGEI